MCLHSLVSVQQLMEFYVYFMSQTLKMVDVVAYTDNDPITARGTPMARPKIGDSIVDVIGRTPMVRSSLRNYNFNKCLSPFFWDCQF